MTNNYILNKLSIQISNFNLSLPILCYQSLPIPPKTIRKPEVKMRSQTFKHQPHKMVKHTQTIFGGWRLKGSEVKLWVLVFLFVLFNYLRNHQVFICSKQGRGHISTRSSLREVAGRDCSKKRTFSLFLVKTMKQFLYIKISHNILRKIFVDS